MPGAVVGEGSYDERSLLRHTHSHTPAVNARYEPYTYPPIEASKSRYRDRSWFTSIFVKYDRRRLLHSSKSTAITTLKQRRNHIAIHSSGLGKVLVHQLRIQPAQVEFLAVRFHSHADAPIPTHPIHPPRIVDADQSPITVSCALAVDLAIHRLHTYARRVGGTSPRIFGAHFAFGTRGWSDPKAAAVLISWRGRGGSA